MPLSSQQRQQTEDRIRAAASQLLRGDLPPGGQCDIKTLAATAGVSRAALYRTYPHLKEDFERSKAQARAAGQVTDPREGQITRLKEEIQQLQRRLNDQGAVIAELTEFKTRALSRLAAQHDELTRLQAQASNLLVLPSRPPSPVSLTRPEPPIPGHDFRHTTVPATETPATHAMSHRTAGDDHPHPTRRQRERAADSARPPQPKKGRQ